jgi:hypothetical protein
MGGSGSRPKTQEAFEDLSLHKEQGSMPSITIDDEEDHVQEMSGGSQSYRLYDLLMTD